VALLALLAGLTIVLATDAPLTNVDVVRMTAGGMAPEEIIRVIQSAGSTRFDLDPEIVEELLRAGVARSVVEAMRLAQPGTPASPSAAPTAEARIVIALLRESAEGKKPGILVPRAGEHSRDASLAFYVLCVEPTHVPDAWSSRSPLGTRFPRHRLLWLHEASQPREGPDRLHLVAVDVPDRQAISLPAGHHVLEIGVAARTEELSWFPLASATARIELTAARPLEILVRLQTADLGLKALREGRVPSYECEIAGIRPVEKVTDPAP